MQRETAPGQVARTLRMVRKIFLVVALLAVVCPMPALAGQSSTAGESRLDHELRDRARASRGSSRVILRFKPGTPAGGADVAIRRMRGIAGRRLASVGGQVAYVPDSALETLGSLPQVASVSIDRRVHGTLERTGATVGASWVFQNLGVDGTGVGIAVID